MEIFKAKSLFNSIDNNLIKELVEIDDSWKEKIRKIQLKMLEDLNQLCLENDIKLMLGGGSFLGAIRHKGFIPWDDDIDLMMLRDDFEKLLKILNGLPKKYEFQYISPQKNSYCTFAKLMYSNSRLIEVGSENTKITRSIFRYFHYRKCSR